MTLRSSCDSVKTPMEFDRCSHAIFYFFSKYLKTFNLCSGRQNIFYKYQYSKTYTLFGGLNRLQVYASLHTNHNFMLNCIRFLSISTLTTTTSTTSPTLTTSNGCLINRSAICEICTNPS